MLKLIIFWKRRGGVEMQNKAKLSFSWGFRSRAMAYYIIAGQKVDDADLRAVSVEPPVTDEILLVEKSSVRTEESILEEATNTVIGTDVECLTVSLRVSIVACTANKFIIRGM